MHLILGFESVFFSKLQESFIKCVQPLKIGFWKLDAIFKDPHSFRKLTFKVCTQLLKDAQNLWKLYVAEYDYIKIKCLQQSSLAHWFL